MAITNKDIRETIEELYTRLNDLDLDIANLESERDGLLDSMTVEEDEEVREETEYEVDDIIDEIESLEGQYEQVELVIDLLEDVERLKFFV